MSGSILERLETRLSAKPAVISIETLFSDLLEARDRIKILTEENEAMKTVGVPPNDFGPASASRLGGGGSGESATLTASDLPTIAPHISPDTVAHVHTLLTDAEERMSVNAHGAVSSFIARAKKLLEGG